MTAMAQADASKPNPCCNIPQNLAPAQDERREGITVMRCKVCGCRHFELTADPGKIGLRGTAI